MFCCLADVTGDRFDAGPYPTAEEFRRARQRDIPILVFNEHVDEEDEPAQVDFKREVGHYVNGRLWRSFTSGQLQSGGRGARPNSFRCVTIRRSG